MHRLEHHPFMNETYRSLRLLRRMTTHSVRRVLVAAPPLLAAVFGAGALWGLQAAPPEIPAHRLAILSTPNNGSETFLHVVEVGRSFPPPATKFVHLPDAAVKGAVLADGAVLAIADYAPGWDRSFGSALFRLEIGVESRFLCDRIAYASRPFVSPDGRVFVQRGMAGTLGQFAMRVDSLSIDEIDPKTGAAKAIWEGTGYVAHIAGAHGRGLVVYHVQPSGARLILVDQKTGTETVLLPSMPPFATDFSTTATGDLIFQNRHENRSDTWLIERLNLNTGNLETVQEGPRPLAPQGWPRGELSYGYLKSDPSPMSQASDLVDKGASREVVEIRAFADHGAIAAALAFPPGVAAPDVILLDPKGAVIGRLQTPPNTRLQVAGFLP
jgi:hypothetical protein